VIVCSRRAASPEFPLLSEVLDAELQPCRDLVLVFHRMAEGILDIAFVVVGGERQARGKTEITQGVGFTATFAGRARP